MSYPREIGDNKRQKPNIFLKCGCKVGAGCGSACLPFGVSTGGRWSRNSCYFADVSKNGQNPSFRPFAASAFPAIPAKYALFRILRGFLEGFYGACVGLCCLRALRGLWGFVRVRCLAVLGLVACLPFFLSLCSCFYLFSCFPCLSSCPLLVFTLFVGCSWVSFVWVVVSFSLTDYTQKERAQRFCSLRPLFVLWVVC